MNEINQIAALKKQLESLMPLNAENQQKLDKKFRLEFNFNTNHIEGNTITYSETELLLIFDDAKGNHSFRELEEMKGSDVAYQLIQELASDSERPLTEQNIKYLNEILLVRPFWKNAITEDGQETRRLIKVGEYKEMPNSVRLQNGEIFHYASPMETPAKMTELIDWYRAEESKKELTPVELAALLHYKFVLIHPFDDGNGRVSRLLMNYVLFKNNLPPIVIKTEDKKNYLSALNRADTGDINSFISYIAEQLIWSLELSIKAAKGENLDELGDLDKKIKLLKQKLNSTHESVIVTRSKDVIFSIFERQIEPLLVNLHKKLSEFDSLFRSKQSYLTTSGSAYAATLDESIANFKNQIAAKSINKLMFHYDLKNFRKGQDQYSFTCSFEIEFHPNAYDIHSQVASFNFSKLYHEEITAQEREAIIEEIGTYIYNQIEKIL